MVYEIYTEGVCIPDVGGFAFKCFDEAGEVWREGSGWMEDTTINRMDLYAIIQALKSILADDFECATIYSDDDYIVYAFNKGLINLWQCNGWKDDDEDNVKDKDLWQELINLVNLKGNIKFEDVDCNHPVAKSVHDAASLALRKHLLK